MSPVINGANCSADRFARGEVELIVRTAIAGPGAKVNNRSIGPPEERIQRPPIRRRR